MAGWATQVYSREFDATLARVSSHVAALIVEKITDMGHRLESFPHYRMTVRSEFRLRSATNRIIYSFDAAQNVIYLITLGHRREVYR